MVSFVEFMCIMLHCSVRLGFGFRSFLYKRTRLFVNADYLKSLSYFFIFINFRGILNIVRVLFVFASFFLVFHLKNSSCFSYSCYSSCCYLN